MKEYSFDDDSELKRIITRMNNVRSLRVIFNSLSEDLLEKIYEKVTLIYQERKAEFNELRLVEEARREKLELFAKQVRDSDLTFEEVSLIFGKTALPQSERASRIRPPRYSYVDHTGKQRTWTGQGRMPKAMQVAINSGVKKLEDFEIQQ